MGIEKLLNPSTITKLLTVKINDVEMIPDDIISLTFSQDFFNFGIFGSIKIKDSFDLKNNGFINFSGQNKMVVSIQDFLEDKSVRTYRIIDVKVTPYDGRFQYLELKFRDEISWIMANTYISKSFTDTPVNALKEYFTYLGIDDLIEADKMEYDIVDTSTSQSFVVPQNKNVLEFFTYMLRKDNIRLYQDRYKIYVKEIIPSQMEVVQNDKLDPVEDLEWSDDIYNNGYIFKIHDAHEVNTNFLESEEEQPISMINSWGIGHDYYTDTVNLTDALSDLAMNDMDISESQSTKGLKYKNQETQSPGQQKADIFDTYMANNQVYIAVTGTLKFGNIGGIVKADFKGNPMHANSELEGNQFSKGKYFVGEVVDKIIGDKLIQRIRLMRADPKKPKDVK